MMMRMMRMECVCFFCILLCVSVHTTSSAVYNVKVPEKNVATLPCGDLTRGEVTWSRDVHGKKVDLLTSRKGAVTKHTADPENRYGSGVNLVLTIFKASRSDAGKYYCDGAVVELTVTPKKTFKPTTDDQSEDHTEHTAKKNDVWKVVVGIMAVSCTAAVASIILLSIYFTKRKAQKKIEQLYTKVNKPKK